jgi:hypothetical protein
MEEDRKAVYISDGDEFEYAKREAFFHADQYG